MNKSTSYAECRVRLARMIELVKQGDSLPEILAADPSHDLKSIAGARGELGRVEPVARAIQTIVTDLIAPTLTVVGAPRVWLLLAQMRLADLLQAVLRLGDPIDVAATAADDARSGSRRNEISLADAAREFKVDKSALTKATKLKSGNQRRLRCRRTKNHVYFDRNTVSKWCTDFKARGEVRANRRAAGFDRVGRG